MEHLRRIDADGGAGGGRLILVAAPVVLAGYAVTLSVALRLGPLEALVAGAANAVPILIFGFVALRIVATRIAGRPAAVQIAGHLVVGTAFSLLAYWLLMVLLGLLSGVSATEFSVRPFPNRAMAWQLLENLTTYGIIAALGHLEARRAPVSLLLRDGSEGAQEGKRLLSRYFIRSGEELMPVDVGAIVSIAGADDYAEVSTTAGRHLVRMTLAEFERALDPARFIRVHRSRIVNVERIARAEPAGGGRMLLHMEDGEMIQASRAGSRLLRDRVI